MAGESVRVVWDCSRERWEGPGEAVEQQDHCQPLNAWSTNNVPPDLLEDATIACVISVRSGKSLSVRV